MTDFALFATEPIAAPHQRPPEHVYVTEDAPCYSLKCKGGVHAYDLTGLGVKAREFRAWAAEAFDDPRKSGRLVITGSWPEYRAERRTA